MAQAYRTHLRPATPNTLKRLPVSRTARSCTPKVRNRALAKKNSIWNNSAVRYRIEISKKAREQLRALPKEQRRNIGWRMEEMREDLRGDVLKLQAKGNYYRLRVGNFRVLFLLAGDAIQVYGVKDRKEAYE